MGTFIQISFFKQNLLVVSFVSKGYNLDITSPLIQVRFVFKSLVWVLTNVSREDDGGGWVRKQVSGSRSL